MFQLTDLLCAFFEIRFNQNRQVHPSSQWLTTKLQAFGLDKALIE
jgi:hypothetical protein